ncbi:MAG: 4'-phosphopantetheinyl transferase superfamily protein [Hyphomonadaceae bacterium]|nr:4'-phosphopantetheinyl transferase superfamily protein [Hyphomonadaceae bacterium]
MIQVLSPGEPVYGTTIAAGPPYGKRLARAMQSDAAEELCAVLRRDTGIAAGPSSKSHSRAVVAAALARAGHVGIDVEFRAPGRPIDKIALFLSGAAVTGEDAGYRVFTFREAYFKAFGDWPEKALLRDVGSRIEARYSMAGIQVLHEAVYGDFMLTLVWRA